ncbi:unnamed protein product [Heligmosomoides polygyrus]|uniref:Uncharacterized protein n=1 Tax=Heligmosomoides polygyrus TaxID=6339 RepID=A0A183G7G6_HELPZ|nr:unnamed protein product [Heligmosomoides polygyrus]
MRLPHPRCSTATRVPRSKLAELILTPGLSSMLTLLEAVQRDCCYLRLSLQNFAWRLAGRGGRLHRRSPSSRPFHSRRRLLLAAHTPTLPPQTAAAQEQRAIDRPQWKFCDISMLLFDSASTPARNNNTTEQQPAGRQAAPAQGSVAGRRLQKESTSR